MPLLDRIRELYFASVEPSGILSGVLGNPDLLTFDLENEKWEIFT